VPLYHAVIGLVVFEIPDYIFHISHPWGLLPWDLCISGRGTVPRVSTVRSYHVSDRWRQCVLPCDGAWSAVERCWREVCSFPSQSADVAGARLNGQLYCETKLQVFGGRCYSDSRILVPVQVDVILQPPVRTKPTTMDGAMPTEAW